MEISAKQPPDVWTSDVNWPDYESYVFGSLHRLSPGSVVCQNVHVAGILSGRSRQIDVLVERKSAEFNLKVAVELQVL